MSILIGELFENDTEAAKQWMIEPNTLLFGRTPIEVCLTGEGEYLMEWIKNRLSPHHECDSLKEKGDSK